ncbi:MAG: restriction endonuclease subunit S [Bacillota bacterium]|nr:restriction endonuclease subunit S [Bacillota bacterium]
MRFFVELNPSPRAERHSPEMVVSFVPMEALGEFGGLRLDAEKRLDEVLTGYTYFAENDVLVAKITPCFENGKGALAEGLANRTGFGTTELYVLRARPGLVSRFLFYLTISHPFRKIGESEMYGAGGQKRVPPHVVRDFRFARPSLAEQRAIALFLDRETARIDRLVACKKRLIELLSEKRAALITRAVTRGLDSGVPLKDSGVNWLGEIPAHWETRRLKELSALQTGLTLGKTYEGQQLTTRPYLRVANVQDGYLDLAEITEIEVPVQDVHHYELQAGDVLMTEGGDFDKLGRGYVWEGQIAGCLHQNHIFVVRPQPDRLNSHLLALVMSSHYGRAYFTAESKQSTNLASTNTKTLRNFPIPLPPLSEQEAIVGWVKLQTAKIDQLTGRIREGIDRLHEYRTALIWAAVTGKIDVHEEVEVI